MGWEALEQWGDDVTRIEPLAGGVANDVWSVRVNDRLAVGRLGTRSDADLAWETHLLQHLDHRGLTIPVPIPTADGRLFAAGLVVMTYIEGAPPDTEADWRRVAATLRQLHRLTEGWPQRPGWRSSTDLLHTDTGTKVNLADMPPKAVARCRAAWARLAGRPTSVVHGDPNPRNVRITANRVALIDWDEAHLDVPDLDLALPHNAAALDDSAHDIAAQASAAWEAAVCWADELLEKAPRRSASDLSTSSESRDRDEMPDPQAGSPAALRSRPEPDKTRERSNSMRLLLVWFAVIVAVTVAGCWSGSTTADPGAGAWAQTAASPLSPRAQATVAWTGSEILVVGGDQFACPSHLDCAPPDDPALSDAAIYDPQTDRWRPIANAPMPVRWARSVSLDGDVFLLAWTGAPHDEQALLQYEPSADAWTSYPLPPSANVDQIVATDESIVLYPSSHEVGRGSDLVFHPEDETWTQLEESPLGAGFDRRLVWLGGALYLFDHKLVPAPGGASGPALVRAARLGGEWETLPTGETLGQSLWLVDGGRVILPALGCADGGATNGYGRCIPFGAIFDTETNRWSELPAAPRRGEQAVTSSGAIGSDNSVISIAGYPMFDAATDTWFDLPAVTAEGFRDVTAAGRFGFTFGGVRLDAGTSEGTLLGDGWIWRPSTPG